MLRSWVLPSSRGSSISDSREETVYTSEHNTGNCSLEPWSVPELCLLFLPASGWMLMRYKALCLCTLCCSAFSPQTHNDKAKFPWAKSTETVRTNKSLFSLLMQVKMRESTNQHRQQLLKSLQILGLHIILKCLTSIGQINIEFFKLCCKFVKLGFQTFYGFPTANTMLMSKNILLTFVCRFRNTTSNGYFLKKRVYKFILFAWMKVILIFCNKLSIFILSKCNVNARL